MIRRVALLLSLGLAACSSVAPLNERHSGTPCLGAAVTPEATLRLPPAAAAPAAAANKSAPLPVAQAVPLQAGPDAVGLWRDAGTGGRTWRLSLAAEGASSMSVRIEGLALPEGAALWACAPDASIAHGPYRLSGPAGTGQLWTPQVPGAVMTLVVVGPADAVEALRFEVTEAYVGFR